MGWGETWTKNVRKITDLSVGIWTQNLPNKKQHTNHSIGKSDVFRYLLYWHAYCPYVCFTFNIRDQSLGPLHALPRGTFITLLQEWPWITLPKQWPWVTLLKQTPGHTAAFIIPFCVLLTSSPVMWRKECHWNFSVLRPVHIFDLVICYTEWGRNTKRLSKWNN
jgi:hypothetical protein